MFDLNMYILRSKYRITDIQKIFIRSINREYQGSNKKNGQSTETCNIGQQDEEKQNKNATQYYANKHKKRKQDMTPPTNNWR